MSFLSHTLIFWLSISYAQPISPLTDASWQKIESQLTTGSCEQCNLSPQAKWYFENEIIALSAAPPVTALITLPNWLQKLPEIRDDTPVWIASPELIESAILHASDQMIELPDGQPPANFSVIKLFIYVERR